MTPQTGQTIRLADGRTLAYAEYGDPYGRLIFFFHGQPGNRLFRHADEALTASQGVRLITIDRPGYGLSDLQPRRRLLDWPQDVAQLADALGSECFAVLGFSGGGPYAAACALSLQPRVTRAGLADSAPPLSEPAILKVAPRPLWFNYLLARYAPPLLHLIFRAFWRYSRRNPAAFIDMALAQSPQVDRDVLARPGMQTMLLETWQENIRVDSHGYVQDFQILAGDWGFRLRDLPPGIHLWHGSADVNTPPAWGEYMMREIPGCQATIYPNEGHFALFTHWADILQQLL